MKTWPIYLAVGAGSALGAVCRMWAGLAVASVATTAFPWATLMVNVIGSWLIARFATHASLHEHGRVARLHPFLVAGFCGGFTTFSLFSLEAVTLVSEGRAGWAALYVGISVSSWLGAAWLGDRSARRAAGQ